MSKKPPPGTQSVLRAVRLLKTLTSEAREMDLAELTRAAGFARTTTHRLLSALESEGLVARRPATGAYHLGPAAIALGTQAMRANDLRAVVRPYLESLAERTGETATLEVLSDGRMLILDEALGRHLVGTQPSLGTAWAIHATATGKALLAELEPGARDELLPDRLPAFTSHTITRRREMAAELARVRERGWAATREELEDGFVAIAAVVLDAMGEPAAAISLNAPTSRCGTPRMRELGELLRSTAAEISTVLSGGRSASRG